MTRSGMNTLGILKYIVNHQKIRPNDCTIMITGRSGPTGKSWLCNELCKLGYKAMELTDFVMSKLLNDDGYNHVITDINAKLVVIVLNEILPMYENKWRKISNFKFDDVLTFTDRGEAEHIIWDMIQIADRYGVVTQADFKYFAGLNNSHAEQNLGWTGDLIRKARVVTHPDGYHIEFPKPVLIMD